MLPGQPVGLQRPSRDEHSPSVGVNALGQHLSGQESEGNHQSPEQEQRAGPQIHQSIGDLLPQHEVQAAAAPTSAPCGTPGSALPRWPLCSPTDHGDGAVTAAGGQQRTQSSGMAARPVGEGRSEEDRAPPALLRPVVPGLPEGLRSGTELLFTSLIAQCVLML